jgi:RimJ/RimL family protein N-acetyltransferase
MPQIELVPGRRELLDAVEGGGEALSRALGGARIVDGWDVSHRALVDRLGRITTGEDDEWGLHLYLLAAPRTLFGWGGFKGPPSHGTVELGYEVSPAVEGKGMATAAAAAMVAKARAAGVRSVIAHTLPERNASCRVLEKNGFELEDRDAREGDRHVWRWRLSVERA